ncbi:hypothetical protein EWD52_23470 [Salmonella enterica subsp. enterica serovar Braenderup]|nr:hypothetical protein [Salmonella enterica subsp. enterica serovar Braenderup]ECD1500259.1 hypothetical protein [Salmonella enterica subsp. enterica serovar Braenderup]
MNYDNFSMFDDSYDPTKSNVLGESLSPTAGYSDQLPAMDFENDNRTAFDWKEQARQVNIDANPNPDIDDENMFTSQAGNKYAKVSNSKADQVMAAVGAFLATSQQTGNDGAAAMAAGKAVYGLDAKAKRFAQIDKLESTKRYQQVDIEKWLETGDNRDLLTNAGKLQNVGGGVMINDLTGERIQVSNPQEKLRQVNLGDRVAFVDAQGNEVKSMARGAAPKAVDSATGGSIGLDAIENEGGQGFQKDPQTGQWTKPKFNSHGQIVGYEVAGVKQTEQLNAQQTAGQPTAQQSQQATDLDTLAQAANAGKVGTFTGQVVSRLPNGAVDVINSTQGDQTERAAFNAANRIDANMQNMGIAAATQMGASGINTDSEAERYFKSMPRLDRSSPQALTASIQAIQNYTQQYNANKAAKAGAAPVQQPAAPAGGATQVRRNPQTGKLEIVGG